MSAVDRKHGNDSKNSKYKSFIHVVYSKSKYTKKNKKNAKIIKIERKPNNNGFGKKEEGLKKNVLSPSTYEQER